MSIVLMLGSAPMAARAALWPRAPFEAILAINNAHAIRPDWTHHIHPFDFPPTRVPTPREGQTIVTEADFVPAQNALGGFVYAGATMAFTAAYWALHALRPRTIAAFGCDMHYPATGPTHFYGTGTPDPLRPDITLRSLEAKSARLMVLAAMRGCAMVNLSTGPSRLVFPRTDRGHVGQVRPMTFHEPLAAEALAEEARLNYRTPSGFYRDASPLNAAALDAIDALWLATIAPARVRRLSHR